MHFASIVRMALALAMVLAVTVATASEPPRRIASFNVCADQLVVTLADPEQVLGLSPYAGDPAISVVAQAARSYPRLALQAEAMVSLKPDLVLVGTWDRPLTQRLLRALGLRVMGVDVVGDLAAAYAQVRALATLFGHPGRGQALIARIEAARQRLLAAPRPAASSALIVGNAGYTVGPDSLAGALLREAGLRPPAGAPAGYGGHVPLERLVRLRPDFLVMEGDVGTPYGQGALYLTHPALRALYPADKRILLPSRFTLCAGPSLAAAFDYLATVMGTLATAR
ncbi:MAG: ABC transporter substrate-binding protein [Hyphomicrobiales bacterium]|nr:ABC transporter substrate-binding protein [Hyphomicrobiales bacterium]